MSKNEISTNEYFEMLEKIKSRLREYSIIKSKGNDYFAFLDYV